MNDKKREEAIGGERSNEETDGRWDGRIEKAKNYGRMIKGITKRDDGRTVWDEGEKSWWENKRKDKKWRMCWWEEERRIEGKIYFQ